MARIKKTTLSKSPRSASTPSKIKSQKSPSAAEKSRSSGSRSPNKRKADLSSVRNTSTTTVRKKRRRKAGTNAIREIQHYQKSRELLIPKLSFSRVVKEILHTVGSYDMRIRAIAMEALHEATEAFIVRYLEETNLVAIHAKRVTIQAKDMKLLGVLKYK